MRPALMLGAFVGVFVTGLPGQAQAPPDVRVINVTEVLVRSGPSDKFYPTSRLAQGERVVVVPQPPDALQAGWLAIKPPRGSFSWINQRFVEVIVPGTGKVVADTPIPVLVGSSESKDEPTKEGIKATRGSQVIILDKANYTDRGVWLPILPQPGEVRYIPESAVLPSASAPAVAANSNLPMARPTAAPGVPVVAPTPSAGAAGVGDEVVRNLQKAADAETDPVRRAQILQMLASLPPRSSAAQQAVYPSTVVAAAAPAGGNTALYAGGSAATFIAAAKWSDYGELRRTAFREADGRPVYALVDAQGHTRIYATPLPNLSLEPYLGRHLSLYGPTFYNQNERVNEMTVSHVAPLPDKNRY